MQNNRRIAILLIGAFLLLSFIESLNHFPFHQLSSAGFLCFSLVWTQVTYQRILHRNKRTLMTWIGLMMALLFLIRVIKYAYTTNSFIERILWYLSYVPELGAPLFSFYVALLIDRGSGYKALKGFRFLIVPYGLLVLLILTNDLHQLAFRFNSVLHSNNIYTHGPLFYIALAWIILLTIATFIIIINRCSLSQSRKLSWIPLMLAILSLALSAIYIMNGSYSFRLFHIFQIQFQNIVLFSVIGLWESCIQIGLLTTNSDYGRLFQISSLHAQICDLDGKIRYQGLTLPSSSENIRPHEQSIHGGTVRWFDDISSIRRLNEDLSELAAELAGETTLLSRENELEEERVRYELQNRTYDSLLARTAPQLSRIETLLQDDIADEGRFRHNLMLASVLLAYVKRYANLYLLAEQSEMIARDDLLLAMQESAEYADFLGVTPPTVSLPEGKALIAGSEALSLYEQFEQDLEASLQIRGGLPA